MWATYCNSYLAGMAKNLFIALEGIDGSGKSTQTEILAKRMADNGMKVYRTFEPTDNFIGTLIRDILKGKRKAHDKTIAGLFVADRLHHILNEEDGMKQKLEEGFHVITDRYYFSSYAYHGTHMDLHWVIDANRLAADTLKPDVTIFIDVAAETSMQRINKNRAGTELYETLENLNKVRNKYFEAFELTKGKENVVIIDGNRGEVEIAEDVWKEVRRLL